MQVQIKEDKSNIQDMTQSITKLKQDNQTTQLRLERTLSLLVEGKDVSEELQDAQEAEDPETRKDKLAQLFSQIHERISQANRIHQEI